jgi:hypothetical protein
MRHSKDPILRRRKRTVLVPKELARFTIHNKNNFQAWYVSKEEIDYFS